MSHCTKFKFQYTDRTIICKVFSNLGLSYKDTIVKTSGEMKWSVDEYTLPFGSKRNAIMAKSDGFNYFMENFGNHYELSIEKHNMTSSDKRKTTKMANEFQKKYIEQVANTVINDMNSNGNNAILDKTQDGYAIRFGSVYEKSILLKFENGRVIEEVQGVKGESCVSLTEALENMLSSPEVDLNTEWTSEYYEDANDGMSIYNLEY